jgi:hypothetical protein
VAYAGGGSSNGEVDERDAEGGGQLLRSDRPVGEATLVVGRRRIADEAKKISVIGETVTVDDEGRIRVGVGERGQC